MKERICKGTSKARGHGCGKQTKFYKYGLCNDCLYNFLYKTEEGYEILQRTKLKAKSEVKKAEKKKTREQKEKLKTISQLIGDAKKPFQKWIRKRDEELPCISCGAESAVFHAGHYYKAELYSGLIFDPDNVHKQCQKCNTYLGGNEINYREGLINRYGSEYVEMLEGKANENRSYKYEREELRAIKKKYNELLKSL